jgi:hypothetical protein
LLRIERGNAKKERVMKNTIKFKAIQRIAGVIAFVAIIGPVFFASCEVNPEDQTVITVTGIPETHNGKYAFVGIYKNAHDDEVAGISLPVEIRNGKVDLYLIDEKSNMVSVKGAYTVVIIITENSSPNSTELYSGTALNVGMNKGPTTVAWTRFTPITN